MTVQPTCMESMRDFKRENPAATYTWFYAHRLSLIVVQGSSSSQNAVDLFGNLESLYAFISSSKKRVSWFDNAQKKT